jgi:hypothetical protein
MSLIIKKNTTFKIPRAPEPPDPNFIYLNPSINALTITVTTEAPYIQDYYIAYGFANPAPNTYSKQLIRVDPQPYGATVFFRSYNAGQENFGLLYYAGAGASNRWILFAELYAGEDTIFYNSWNGLEIGNVNRVSAIKQGFVLGLGYGTSYTDLASITLSL